ncbi:MAG: carbonate dehydratase [Rhodanobacteraceae bacterium]|nr:carbonate dehydratase [Pseudomonadota bacterium]
MSSINDLLESNHRWSESQRAQDPQFFTRLSQQQAPKYLWIGCSDSRVPANQIVDLPPGEVFVHRNVANVVVHADLNCLAVMQFAVDVLKVEHIMVVGHYGCGGVQAVLDGERLGLVDNWLRHVGDVLQKHRESLMTIAQAEPRQARLCELNVIEQVVNVCQSTIVRDAWERSQRLAVHGWCYGLSDGRLRELGMDVSHPEELAATYERALKQVMPAPVATP